MITDVFMKKQKEVANVESAKVAVETGKELTASETLSAYLANHAVNHYCAALGESEEEIVAVLEECKKGDGEYWLFTQPAIGGKRSDGTPNPTKEEWEKLNPAAVHVATLAGKEWYKRAFIIGDARGVRSVVNGYENYNKAVDGAQKKVDNTLAAAAAMLGVDVETLKALQKK